MLSKNGKIDANNGTNPIDKLLSGTNLWFARNKILRPFILALRNIFRQKTRLILTLITLVMAGSVFITVINLQAMIYKALDESLQMQNYDLQVGFTRQYRTDELKQEIEKVDGIKTMDTWIATLAKRIRADQSEGSDIYVTGIPVSSSLFSLPVMIEGRWLNSGDQNSLVIASTLLKNEPDLQVGKNIVLKINNRSYPFNIVGIMSSLGTSNPNSVYVNYDAIANILHNKIETNTILLQSNQSMGFPVETVKTDLDSQLKKDNYYVSSMQTKAEIRNSVASIFNSVIVVMILMAMVLAVVGGLGLMGTMSINIIERTREIGVLRAIGASNAEVYNAFMIEGVGIGIISCLISIPVSIPITSVMGNAIGINASGVPWPGITNLNGVLIWIILVIVLCLISIYFPARDATRLTVREVLAYE